LRRSLLFVRESTDEIDCLYLRSDVQYEDGSSENLDACLVDTVIYNLPVGLLDTYRSDLHSGKTRIYMEGARLQKSEGVLQANVVILTRRAPNITIYKDIPHTQRSHGFLATTNVKVVAVRVTSKDSSVSLSKQELSAGMFGNQQNVTLASQLHDCSAGAYTITPGVPGGVAELYIDVNTVGVETKNLETLLRGEFVKHIGSEEDYNHILFCLPQGTTAKFNNWVAYAYRDTRFSFFNNEWCGSLTSKMHELGHNLGEGHSGEADDDCESFLAFSKLLILLHSNTFLFSLHR